MRRRTLLTPLLCTVLGALIGGYGVYYVMEKHHWHDRQIVNREYKAAIAELSARTLARLRTGTLDDAAFFLEDHLDSYLVGVPMGEAYPQLTDRCQHAMAIAKVYRSRFTFPGGCKLHTDELHFKHVPAFLEDVPLLAPDHEWLDGPMRKVREMPPAAAKP